MRKELHDFSPDCMVISNNSTAVQTFSSIKHVVQLPGAPEDFLRNKNNHLLDALIVFHKAVGVTDEEKEKWTEELNKDAIVDEQGNQFIKVCSHQGEGADDDVVNKRTFVVYRRVKGFDFNPGMP